MLDELQTNNKNVVMINKLIYKIFYIKEESLTKEDEDMIRIKYLLIYKFKDDKEEIKKVEKYMVKKFFLRNWKRRIVNILVYSSLIVATYCAVIFYLEPRVKFIYSRDSVPVTSYSTNDTLMTLDNFLMQIQYKENRYLLTNKSNPNSQHWGVYQLGKLEREIGGYEWVDKEHFEKDGEIQCLCMINLMKYNKKCLQKYIDKYTGKIVGGILITPSGIIAGAHLGMGKVMQFLDSDGKVIPGDDNNTPVTDYLKIGGYKLNI